eukprot:EG_transcript_37385
MEWEEAMHVGQEALTRALVIGAMQHHLFVDEFVARVMWRQLRNLHPRDADGKERFLRNVHHLHSQHLFSDVKFCVAAFNDFDTPFGPSTLLADLLQLVNQNLLRFELLFVLPPDAVFGQLQAQLICAVEAGEADLAPLLHHTLALAALDT